MESPPQDLKSSKATKEIASNVVRLHHSPQVYSLQEARAILPLISKLTRRWHDRADKILLSFHYAKNESTREHLEKSFNSVLEDWADSIEKLGATVKGPWLVDFDTGDGHYWCWQYPEEDIHFRHSHHGGFESRQPIAE